MLKNYNIFYILIVILALLVLVLSHANAAEIGCSPLNTKPFTKEYLKIKEKAKHKEYVNVIFDSCEDADILNYRALVAILIVNKSLSLDAKRKLLRNMPEPLYVKQMNLFLKKIDAKYVNYIHGTELWSASFNLKQLELIEHSPLISHIYENSLLGVN